MEPIKNFEQLILHLGTRKQRSRVAVVWPDACTCEAVAMALDAAFIDAILVGADPEMQHCTLTEQYPGHVTTIPATDVDDAARRAVALVREGSADIIMKGLLNTDNLLRAVLNRDCGILPRGRVLTHIAAAEIPGMDRLLFFTDAAVIPFPTDEQRLAQVRYLLATARSFGIDTPRLAMIHCSEKVDERHFPCTGNYVAIKAMADNGDLGPCLVDGPLDLKCALDSHALEKKHMTSCLNGQADALLFPDIESANVFYKAITFLVNATTAAILCGPDAPVVLTSRGDSALSKFNSLALAALQ